MKKLLEKLRRRRYAYRRLFLEGDGMSADGQIVLADLAKFCRATSSTAMVSPVSQRLDPMAMAMAEGRREVWLRIMAHLHIDEKVIFNLNQEDNNDG
jgi:hypothetical protein